MQAGAPINYKDALPDDRVWGPSVARSNRVASRCNSKERNVGEIYVYI